MRIDGRWLPDETQAWCPTVSGLVVVSEHEYPARFLVDTGAAQTVLGSAFVSVLQSHLIPSAGVHLTSAAGEVKSLYAAIRLRLIDITDRRINFNLNCAVLTDPAQANTHLLGRDILDYFALICDREAGLVALLRSPHTYTLTR